MSEQPQTPPPASPAFDPLKAWSELGLGRQILLGCSFAFFIFTFFPWYGFSSSVAGIYWRVNAWTGGALAIFAILGMFGSITFVILYALPNLAAQKKVFSIGQLASAGVTVLFTFIWMITYGTRFSGPGAGIKFGAILALLAALGMGAGAVLGFLADKNAGMFQATPTASTPPQQPPSQ